MNIIRSRTCTAQACSYIWHALDSRGHSPVAPTTVTHCSLKAAFADGHQEWQTLNTQAMLSGCNKMCMSVESSDQRGSTASLLPCCQAASCTSSPAYGQPWHTCMLHTNMTMTVVEPVLAAAAAPPRNTAQGLRLSVETDRARMTGQRIVAMRCNPPQPPPIPTS